MKSRYLPVCACLLAFGPALAAENRCPRQPVTFSIEGLAGSDEESFKSAFQAARAKVCAWLGPDFAGPLTVNVEDSRGPSMALLPAWRGQHGTMLFRSDTTRMGRSAIVHELVHVYAPNANRFLAEGLAVHAHEHLGGAAAHPNFGTDIHRAAKEFAGQADIPAFDRIAVPARLELGGLREQETYIVAGSFVRFLIEAHGLDRFRRLYAMTPLVPRAKNAGDPARWREIYGRSLEALAAEWKAKIGD